MLFILTAVVCIHFPPYLYFKPPLFLLHVDFYFCSFVHLLLVIHSNGSYCLEYEMPKILGILETNNIAFFPSNPMLLSHDSQGRDQNCQLGPKGPAWCCPYLFLQHHLTPASLSFPHFLPMLKLTTFHPAPCI